MAHVKVEGYLSNNLQNLSEKSEGLYFIFETCLSTVASIPGFWEAAVTGLTSSLIVKKCKGRRYWRHWLAIQQRHGSPQVSSQSPQPGSSSVLEAPIHERE